VTDYFALLDEPRRPWLEIEALKDKFHMLAAEAHPDRQHQSSEDDRLAANRRYADLNAAYHCLREPRTRLRHLLELESGARPSDLTNVPDALMDLFFALGQTSREVEAFLTEKSRASSPLLQVQLFERGQAWLEKLGGLRRMIALRRDSLLDEVKTLDAAWDSQDSKPLGRLQEIWRLLGFSDRWLAQIQERIVRLSL
jgi:DnaJ-domain-containing protein 1